MAPTTIGHYSLGLAGLALLRTWHSDDSIPAAHFQRLLEMADVATTDDILTMPLATPELAVVEGYSRWASTYNGPNPMVDAEDAVVNPILAANVFAGASALDIGCGTGRKVQVLHDLGCEVIGVDLTPAMLEVARSTFPDAEFREGSFDVLPVDDASVDVAISSLAICHAPSLAPVFAEIARVLRPGGRVVIADPHPMVATIGGQAFFPDAGEMPFVRNQGRPVSEYFAAATGAGLVVDEMHESPISTAALEANPLFSLYPEVTRAAIAGLPYLLTVVATKPTGGDD